MAADLQLVSASADSDLVDYHADSPSADESATEAWVIDDHDMLAIFDKPELGLTQDMELVDKSRLRTGWRNNLCQTQAYREEIK